MRSSLIIVNYSIVFDYLLCRNHLRLLNGTRMHKFLLIYVNYSYILIIHYAEINRGCSLEPECTTREIISKCSHEWNMENTHACEICCEGDRCNAATMVTVSSALFLTVGALLGLYYA